MRPTAGCKVALVDPEANPGGVCLYRGCIPSKALLHVADVINESKHAKQFGVEFGSPPIDLDRLRAFKNKVVVAAHQRRRAGLEAAQDSVRAGDGAFRDAHTLDVDLVSARKDTLQFEHAIIATGSQPATSRGCRIDDPRVMDSTGALDLPDIPKTLLVVGGGYIGLELGSVYAALGSRVTVVEMTDGPAAGRRSRSRQHPREADRGDAARPCC